MGQLDSSPEAMLEKLNKLEKAVADQGGPDYDSIDCRIRRLKDDIEALKRIKHQQKKLDKLEEKKLEILRDIEKSKGRRDRHKDSRRRSKH